MKTTLWTRIYLFQSLKDRVSREMLVNMKQAAALYSYVFCICIVLYLYKNNTIQLFTKYKKECGCKCDNYSN